MFKTNLEQAVWENQNFKKSVNRDFLKKRMLNYNINVLDTDNRNVFASLLRSK